MNMNMELGLNIGFNNNYGYGRVLGFYFSGNLNRYNIFSFIGYNGGSVRGDFLVSLVVRNVWVNGLFINQVNFSSSGVFAGFGSGNFGFSFGNGGVNWGIFFVVIYGGGIIFGYISGNGFGYGFGDGNYRSGVGVYGRIFGGGGVLVLFFVVLIGGLDVFYVDLYRGGSGSVYGDLIWRFDFFELDGSGLFGFGLGNVVVDVVFKIFEGFIGSYSVINR